MQNGLNNGLPTAQHSTITTATIMCKVLQNCNAVAEFRVPITSS